jgi:uncharacterized protein YndB with AHSA1/START domain
MPGLVRSRTLSVSIDCPPARVYAFVRNAENIPRWAGGLAKAVRKTADGWILETADGPLGFAFVADNDLGVLDHVVTVAPGVDVRNPMRVVANGSGSEVTFTLFELPGMTAEKFAEDARMVERDLRALKRVLEAEPAR